MNHQEEIMDVAVRLLYVLDESNLKLYNVESGLAALDIAKLLYSNQQNSKTKTMDMNCPDVLIKQRIRQGIESNVMKVN